MGISYSVCVCVEREGKGGRERERESCSVFLEVRGEKAPCAVSERERE